jgi:hypothetical protein
MGGNEQFNVIVSDLEHDEWYTDIIYHLKNLSFHEHSVVHKKRELKIKSMIYYSTQDKLSWKNLDGIILKCVNKDEVDRLNKELHLGYCDGHFVAFTTSRNIPRAKHYYPTLFTDTHRYVKSF